MKIIFMGTPNYAKVILEEILKQPDMRVICVYTQPDKPVGRKKVLTPPAVKLFAEQEGIICHQPESLRKKEIAQDIKKESPDFIIVAAYGQLLPKEILDIAPCINLHASLLPLYRGASPIQQALLNADRFTGVTAMLMEEGLDSGPALAYSVADIKITVRKNELFDELSHMAAKLTINVLNGFADISPILQCEADATYCKKISRQDGLVNFGMDAKSIYNKFRAYEGWPGIYLENGLKLLDIKLLDENGGEGKIERIDEDGIVVGCANGSLKIKILQPPSKKAMDAKSYIRGKRLSVADIFI